MEDKDPEVGFDFKEFLLMWGQTAGLFGLVLLCFMGFVCLILGVALLLKIAGLLFGSIIFFILATLGVTIWGWRGGERP